MSEAEERQEQPIQAFAEERQLVAVQNPNRRRKTKCIVLVVVMVIICLVVAVTIPLVLQLKDDKTSQGKLYH